MPEHATDEKPSTVAAEPYASAEIARLIVAGLVALGVITLDDTALGVITGLIGAAISVGLSWWARRKSTPLAHPRNEHGTKLAPVVANPPSPGTGGSPPR